jgi:hypothetical protein
MSEKILQELSESEKKAIRDFMQNINPKPSLKQIEKLKQEYLNKRNEQ